MKLVIFDLAGTLLPSSAPTAILKAAQDFNISIDTGDLRHTTLEKIGNAAQKHGIDRKQFFDKFWQEYSKEAKKEALFPETREVLTKLREKNIRLALFTDNRRDVVYETLRDHDLEHFFEVIITLDEIKKPKPDPDGLNQILQKLTIANEDVIFVGDRIADKIAGKHAGIDVLFLENSSDLLKLLEY